MTILISWEVDGEQVQYRAEELIWNRAREAPIGPTHWVFTGSLFMDGIFMATVEKSLAAVYNDPAAILNIPLPEGADDTSFVAREGPVPPVDTVIEVILRAVETKASGP